MKRGSRREGAWAGLRRMAGAFRPIAISQQSEDIIVELIQAAILLGSVSEKDAAQVGAAYSRLNMVRGVLTQRVAYFESELGWQYGTERNVLKRF